MRPEPQDDHVHARAIPRPRGHQPSDSYGTARASRIPRQAGTDRIDDH
ncbi:hypothetical protein AB0D46_37950 [Streptomyces sp. NPDC048383]